MSGIAGRMLRAGRRLLGLRAGRLSGPEHWKLRAERYGRRSVLNLDHPERDYDRVTELQKRELYPRLRAALGGSARRVLDFGCGPGRFTTDLAEMTGGRVVGVDVVAELLELAPAHPAIEYRLVGEGELPFADGEFDLIWVCLVLGGLPETSVGRTAGELERVLAPGGLLFLAENTSTKPDGEHWVFRSLQSYRQMFDRVALDPAGDYLDLGERISILAGRKEPR